MFEDSLIESSGTLAARNPWTTAISFAVQTLFGGILLLLSLIYTETLPAQKLVSFLEAPAPPPAAAPAAVRTISSMTKPGSEFASGRLMMPVKIPPTIAVVHDSEQPGGAPPGSRLGVLNSTGGAVPNSPIAELLRNPPVAMPKATVQRIRVSTGVAQGYLIRQVKPQYPALARQARIQGTVVVQAIIGKDGTVESLHIVSGHPLLTQAALQAVKQWLYQPYYLNGEPVEVDTEINVNFTLTE